MKKLRSSGNNKRERLNFVKYWAEYVRNHSDKIWSKQQNVLINSQIQNAKHSKLTPKEYLKMKGELK